MSAADLPLSRYTVLDLTRVRSGPTAVRMLADWGANVIKVEEPGNQDGDGSAFDRRYGADFQNLQRNKRSLTLNLKSPDGMRAFRKLAEKADVIVENYRPGVKHRLGIDYDTLSKVNPRLVYASISGFGETGPYAERPGIDQVIQGMGGIMSITGLPGQGPVRAGIAISDSSAGIYCAFGIVLALLEREHSGTGQWVRTSLLQALIAMLDFQAARWLMHGEVPHQEGNNHPTVSPTGVYKTADGHINIAAGGAMYERLCHALEAPELLTDPRYANFKLRAQNRDALNAAIEARTVTQPSAHWITLLNKAGVPCGPIYSVDQMFADAHIAQMEMAQPVHHPKLGDIRLVGQGVTLTRTPARLRSAAPDRGEHTSAILREAGYTDDDIAALKASGAV